MDLTERLISRELIFKGRMIDVERDVVMLPNGNNTTREVVRHPGAVAVVAIKDGKVILVRQYRYPINSETLEIPAGKLESGEEPVICAQRELREETGYRGSMTHLGTFYTTPGFTDEVMHLFLAKDLIWDPLAADDDEFLGVESIPWEEAVNLAKSGSFIDAKTILGILIAHGRKV
ncbi:MAG: NUDIX hydrolase [Desulfitobacterium hafniense]|nr:NUDIX hydrolase [Desulfitobacterium hafniense]